MLGHPTRQRILAALLRAPSATPGRLRSTAGPGLVPHLSLLESLGVVRKTAVTGEVAPRYRLDVERYRALTRALGAIVDSRAIAA